MGRNGGCSDWLEMHSIVSLATGLAHTTLRRGVRKIGHFKSFTARKIIDYLRDNKIEAILKQLRFHKLKHKKDRTYLLWQEGSHPKLIQCEKMMIQKMEYTHYNPVKRGYVDDPIHWRYPSARNYAEQESFLDVCTEW